MTSHVSLQPDITKAISSVRQRLCLELDGTKNGVLVDSEGRPSLQTQLQAMAHNCNASELERAIISIVHRYAMTAEKVAPMGFIESTRMTLETLSRPDHGSPHSLSKRALEGGRWAQTAIGKRTDLRLFAGTFLGTDEFLKRLVMTALELAGFGGRIVIERSVSNVPSVELTSGNSFGVHPAFGTPLKLQDTYVLCIDGYVEAVHELHHLLEAASEAGMPVVAFIRGASQDVLHTLQVNLKRGRLVFVPIIIPMEIENVNTLKDIAVVSGGDVVSIAKGELISAIKLKDLPIVKSVSITHDRVTLIDPGARKRTAMLLAEVRKKRDDASSPVLVKAFDSRVKSLSSRHVVIRLPDDERYVSRSQHVDYFLRAVKALVDNGTVMIDGEKKLAITGYASSVCSFRCVECLSSLGCAIT